jgi:hypothetical protein
MVSFLSKALVVFRQLTLKTASCTTEVRGEGSAGKKKFSADILGLGTGF